MMSGHGHGAKIGRKMEEAIAALLACPTLAAAAKSCGIAESTLRRWKLDGTFAQRYREERSRLLESTTNLLRLKSLEAVQVLIDISNDKTSPAAVRVSAARSIIALGFAGEMAELEERLAKLEEIAER